MLFFLDEETKGKRDIVISNGLLTKLHVVIQPIKLNKQAMLQGRQMAVGGEGGMNQVGLNFKVSIDHQSELI